VDLDKTVVRAPVTCSILKVNVARALVHEPQIIVCDEPTAALEAETGRVVMEILKNAAVAPGPAVLVVTHDRRIYRFAE
jgi:putative ABC transport system ATP-binding protein